MNSNHRDDFLLTMYGKMWDNIDRHILVVWQSVGVLAGAFAALILAEKRSIALDYTTTLVVLVSGWQIAHVFDASWWFNRNLLIISNIERQFLRPSDSSEIHYYFLQHRTAKLLDHYIIQAVFGAAVAIVILLYHFAERVYPAYISGKITQDPLMALPYAIFLIFGIGLCHFYERQRNEYLTLTARSPGKHLSVEQVPVQNSLD